MGETDPNKPYPHYASVLSLCLDRGGEQLGHFLSIFADEVARLQLMVGEIEAIDPMAAHIIRQILGQVEQVNEGLLDRPDMLEGGISWWEESASANRPTQ